LRLFFDFILDFIRIYFNRRRWTPIAAAPRCAMDDSVAELRATLRAKRKESRRQLRERLQGNKIK
jgi:hypothetical protein